MTADALVWWFVAYPQATPRSSATTRARVPHQHRADVAAAPSACLRTDACGQTPQVSGAVPDPVSRVDHAAVEPSVVQQLEVESDTPRQRRLAATHNDREKQQRALVDQALLEGHHPPAWREQQPAIRGAETPARRAWLAWPPDDLEATCDDCPRSHDHGPADRPDDGRVLRRADVTRTRATRGWMKAACVAAGAAVAVPDARQAWTEQRAARRRRTAGEATSFDGTSFDGTALDGIPVATENLPQSVLDNAGDGPVPSAGVRTFVRGAVVVVALAAALAGSAAVTVAFERWVFRRGEAHAAAGVRLAHTRTGLVLGALTAASALIPDPPEGR